MNVNPYFEFAEPEVIESLDRLLSLNVKKGYYRPGDTTLPEKASPTSYYLREHSTAGIFRGQLNDWPLIPKSFRSAKEEKVPEESWQRIYIWAHATRQMRSFCERAADQNAAFPPGVSAQMSIAQHFGLDTPLLDWSQNIFAAVFFAINDLWNKESTDHLEKPWTKYPSVFVYHIIDERLLHAGIPDEEELPHFAKSAFVRPHPIDRRIERQRGVFTFHPHPSHHPPKVSAKKYVLEWEMIEKVHPILKGLGFTEDYFFPDYAGIARAVMVPAFDM